MRIEGATEAAAGTRSAAAGGISRLLLLPRESSWILSNGAGTGPAVGTTVKCAVRLGEAGGQ